jgi:hypothetical protein
MVEAASQDERQSLKRLDGRPRHVDGIRTAKVVGQAAGGIYHRDIGAMFGLNGRSTVGSGGGLAIQDGHSLLLWFV